MRRRIWPRRVNQAERGRHRSGMAYRIAALLREKDSAAVVQAWFQGMNPRLDDVAPARLLRKGDLEQVGPGVLAAARALAMAG